MTSSVSAQCATAFDARCVKRSSLLGAGCREMARLTAAAASRRCQHSGASRRRRWGGLRMPAAAPAPPGSRLPSVGRLASYRHQLACRCLPCGKVEARTGRAGERQWARLGVRPGTVSLLMARNRLASATGFLSNSANARCLRSVSSHCWVANRSEPAWLCAWLGSRRCFRAHIKL